MIYKNQWAIIIHRSPTDGSLKDTKSYFQVNWKIDIRSWCRCNQLLNKPAQVTDVICSPFKKWRGCIGRVSNTFVVESGDHNLSKDIVKTWSLGRNVYQNAAGGLTEGLTITFSF